MMKGGVWSDQTNGTPQTSLRQPPDTPKTPQDNPQTPLPSATLIKNGSSILTNLKT